MKAEELKLKSYSEILDFIREKLEFDEKQISQIRGILLWDEAYKNKQHRRFDMSGYEDKKGSCTIHNMDILNEFAYLGIYDYTEYLFLDFYKGTPTLYLKFWDSLETSKEFNYSGFTTSEIILEILKLTILSERRTRRRG